MKKWYRKFIIIISFIIGLSVTIWYMETPAMKIGINDPVVKEDFEYLEQCALEVAKTLDTEVIEDDNVKASIEYKEDSLYVTVKLTQYDTEKCKVSAQYPILFDEEIEIKEGIINLKGKIDYDNVITGKTNVPPLFVLIILSIAIGVVAGGAIYYIFYGFYSDRIKRIEKQ